MKTLTSVIVFLILTASVMAAESPFDKGAAKFTGSFLFTYYGGDIYLDGKSITLSPQFSYCLNNGFYIGGIFLYEYSKITYQYNYDSYYEITRSESDWMAGITIEKYFPPEHSFNNEFYSHKGKFVPFLKVSATYGHDGDDGIHGFSGSMGGIYMLSKAVGLETGFSYSFRKVAEYSGNIFQFGTGVTCFIF